MAKLWGLFFLGVTLYIIDRDAYPDRSILGFGYNAVSGIDDALVRPPSCSVVVVVLLLPFNKFFRLCIQLLKISFLWFKVWFKRN